GWASLSCCLRPAYVLKFLLQVCQLFTTPGRFPLQDRLLACCLSCATDENILPQILQECWGANCSSGNGGVTVLLACRNLALCLVSIALSLTSDSRSLKQLMSVAMSVRVVVCCYPYSPPLRTHSTSVQKKKKKKEQGWLNMKKFTKQIYKPILSAGGDEMQVAGSIVVLALMGCCSGCTAWLKHRQEQLQLQATS
uniref:Uncharacterized protein n=1 Tax=Glossina palpalis gambiensis TaxID=67801 RepID=A0A1B0BG94_9MUSC